jgi:LPXTG-motif cell wall-anchored protein
VRARNVTAAGAAALIALAPAAAPASAVVAQVVPPTTPVAGQGYGAVQDRGAKGRAPPAPRRAHRPAPAKAPPATAAQAGPLVTIADFAFASPSTTVRIGQTLTWTNRGPSSHTATAGDGSFDTGVLRKGASASHRFTRAGTFTYMCTIHPSMKGSVRVVAAGGSQARPAPTPAAPTSSPGVQRSAPQPAATKAASGPQLPATGSDPLDLAGVGLAALAAGALGLRLTRRAG